MADNFPVTPGEGRSVATDEIGGIDHQKIKVEFGENGTATEVSAANPLPATISGVSTASKQDAQTTLLEALSALLTTIDADTGNLASILTKITEVEEDTDRLAAIETSVGTLDNAISGSEMQVDVVASLPAGTNAIGKLSANSGVDIGDVDVTSLTGGTVAHDSADSGNPIKVGGRARTTHTAAIANDDRSDLTTDKYGRLLTAGFIPDTKVSGRVTLENETSTTVLEAPGASVRLVVTSIVVTNGGSTAGRVEILDESTAKMIQYAAKEGGGWSITDPNGLFIVTENKPLKAKALATSKFDVFVSAYKIPA